MSQFHHDLLAAAKAVIREKDAPAELLRDTGLFLNHIMARGGLDEVCIAEDHYTKGQFQDAYEHAPPSLYFPPNWEYWGLMLFEDPKYKPPPAGYPQPN